MSKHAYEARNITFGILVDARYTSDLGHEQILSVIFFVVANHARYVQFLLEPGHGGLFSEQVWLLRCNKRISDFEEYALLTRVSK